MKRWLIESIFGHTLAITLVAAITVSIQEGGRTDISCEDQPGTTIHVTDASYGDSSCSPDTLQKVRTYCEGTIVCDLWPRDDVVGNGGAACPGTETLVVQYTCEPATTKYICEEDRAMLSCANNPNTTIDITFAHYGRDVVTVCVNPINPTTVQQSVFKICDGLDIDDDPDLQGICQGQTSCTVYAHNSQLPTESTCNGVRKYLELRCNCVCPSGDTCEGENEGCDADGNCNCIDGFIRDQTGTCIPDCVGCREGEICTKAGTCECGPTTVRYNGSCVTCELECDTNADCPIEGETCNAVHRCECPAGDKLKARCVEPGKLGGACKNGKCSGRRVGCQTSTNMCTCLRGCSEETVCLRPKIWRPPGRRT